MWEAIRTILIVALGIAISMVLGGLIGVWKCSQRRWCPRYLQKQLDEWRRSMAKQNEERRAGKITRISKPTPPDGDQAA